MFCEKCGAQIPDGGDTLCPRCRAAESAPVQDYGQPMGQAVNQQSMGQAVNGQPMGQQFNQQPMGQQFQQPMGQQFNQQPMGQPYQQPMAQGGGFSVNSIANNPMIVMIIKLALAAISLWAAFGPLLSYVSAGASFMGISQYETTSLIDATSGSDVPGDFLGFRVAAIIFMVLALIMSAAAVVLIILPKIAPNVKLPLPPCISYAATAGSLLCSIIGEFITIGFCAKMLDYVKEEMGSWGSLSVALSGFGIFMMIFSFLAIAGCVLLSFVELKKR